MVEYNGNLNEWWRDVHRALSEPAPETELEWRVMQSTKDGSKVQLAPYVSSRFIMDRLDEVVGPQNWSDTYHMVRVGEDEGLMCSLYITDPEGRQVIKSDGAGKRDTEPVKSAVSDSLKRAAVKLGIGRYLYALPMNWVSVSSERPKGKYIYVSSGPAKGKFAPIVGVKPKSTPINGGKPADKGKKEFDGDKSEEVAHLIGKIQTGLNYLSANKIDEFHVEERRDNSIKKHLGVDGPGNLAKVKSVTKLRAYLNHLYKVSTSAPANEGATA